MTAAAPSAPEIGVGPAAFSVHAVSSAVPPLSLVTAFNSVSVGFFVFVYVQVTVSPPPRAIDTAGLVTVETLVVGSLFPAAVLVATQLMFDSVQPLGSVPSAIV